MAPTGEAGPDMDCPGVGGGLWDPPLATALWTENSGLYVLAFLVVRAVPGTFQCTWCGSLKTGLLSGPGPHLVGSAFSRAIGVGEGVGWAGDVQRSRPGAPTPAGVWCVVTVAGARLPATR